MNLNLWQRALVAIRAIPNPQPVTWENLFPLRQVMSGVSVTESSALNYSPVWSGVSTLSRDIAKLPLVLYRNLPNGGGKEPFKEHRLYRVLHDAWNPEMSSFKARETMQALCLLYGNAYAEIVRDDLGRVAGLYPIVPTRVTPIREKDSGRLFYRITNYSGGQSFLAPQNIIHFSSLSLDGIIGEGIVHHAKESFGLGIAAEQFGAAFFGNGTTFGGVVQTPALLTGPKGEETKDNIRTQIEAIHQGVERAHRILVLGGGSTFTQRGTAPNEAQFNETRKHQVTEVARWLNMPPHKLGDLENAHFTNIEESELQYYKGTVSGWLEMEEQEYQRKLVSPLEYAQQTIEHVMEGALRGTSQQRADYYGKMSGIGVFSINDALRKENMNTIGAAGDLHLVPLNMIPIERYDEWITAEIESKKPKALPDNGSVVKQITDGTNALKDELAEQRAVLGKLEQWATTVDGSVRSLAEQVVARQTHHELEAIAVAERAAKEKAERDLLDLQAVWLTARDDGQAAVVARDQALAQLRQVEAERAADAAKHTEHLEAERTLTAQAEFDLIEVRSTLASLQSDLSTAQGQLMQAEQRAAETANAALQESERATASEAEKVQAWADAEDAKRQLAEAHEAVSAAELARREQADKEAAATAAQVRLESEVAEAKRALEDATTARQAAEAAILAHRQAQQDEVTILRAKLLTASRGLIVNAIKRIVRTEAERTRRHERSTTPDKLRRWIDVFYGDLSIDAGVEILAPAIQTTLLWMDSDQNPYDVSRDIIRRYFKYSADYMRSLAETMDGDDLHDAVLATLTRWETERPELVADKVLTDAVQSIVARS